MFDNLSEKFIHVFKKISGKGRLSQSNVEDALKQVRTALLEADVNFQVVKHFISTVREKAMGTEVARGVTPGMQFIKIVQKELANCMGRENEELSFEGESPRVILMVGPNGVGKTTFCGKFARYIAVKKQKKVLLVPADTYRPAAKDQLNTLASRVEVECFDSNLKKSPEKIVSMALKDARKRKMDVVLVDTAGRLHEDGTLMKELSAMKKSLDSSNPEVLMVVDAMAGQEAVSMATAFHRQVGLNGIVLSKMDSDARGGAALSMHYVTKVPIHYISNGEGMRDMELFHPDRLAGRILDQGDVVSLVEKAEEEIDKDQAERMMEKMQKGRFSMDDFLKQMSVIGKLGSMGSLLKMLPGAGGITPKMGDLSVADDQMKRMKVIISSMTKQERNDYKIIDESRINRMAKGSGNSVQKVKEFLMKFSQMEKMMATWKGGLNPQSMMFGGKKKKSKGPWGNRYF
ncbi:MAG: signal recognition particle protein [Halobacteriovoraceae bacterium]|nr:signal recognition particle protein [Halobacteriovoraceae bacterium]